MRFSAQGCVFVFLVATVASKNTPLYKEYHHVYNDDGTSPWITGEYGDPVEGYAGDVPQATSEKLMAELATQAVVIDDPDAAYWQGRQKEMAAALAVAEARAAREAAEETEEVRERAAEAIARAVVSAVATMPFLQTLQQTFAPCADEDDMLLCVRERVLQLLDRVATAAGEMEFLGGAVKVERAGGWRPTIEAPKMVSTEGMSRAEAARARDDHLDEMIAAKLTNLLTSYTVRLRATPEAVDALRSGIEQGRKIVKHRMAKYYSKFNKNP